MRYLLTLISLIVLVPAWATDEIIDRVNAEELGRGENVARVTLADKNAFIRRETHAEEEPMIRNTPIISGDSVETRYEAYAEVEMIDGSLLQIADRTMLDFQAINESWDQESLTVIRLHKGSLFLHTTEVDPNTTRRVIRIDTQSGSSYVEAPGIYRIDYKGNRMRLSTFRGFAELAGESGSVAVYSGEYALVRNMQHPSKAKPFNSFRSDEFERWAYERRPMGSVSSKYVDSSLSSYARDLDDNGSWRYDDQLSRHVWVPYVSTDWAPYRRGYWTNSGSYMTWVSYDPFGFLTHHYGRWMWRASIGWYWVPGYRYSPAWVAWNWYDNYVGWCPLGYYDEPWYYYSSGSRGPRVRIRNTVVVNNYWNYVPASSIVNRRRNYGSYNVNISGSRRITTRRFHIKRDDFNSETRLARALRDPAVNRRRAAARENTTGTLFQPGRRTTGVKSTTASRVRIQGRNTGTVARSRLDVNAPRRSSTSVTRSTNSSTVRRYGSSSPSTTRNTAIYGETPETGGRAGRASVSRSSSSSRSSESSRSSATRSSKPLFQSDSSSVKSGSSNSSRSSVTRSNSGSRTSAARSSGGKTNRSSVTRSSGNNSRSSATRSSGRSSSRTSINRSSSGGKSRSSATRSSGSKSSGSATRSSGGSGSRSSVSRSSSRSSGSKSSSSASRSSSSSSRGSYSAPSRSSSSSSSSRSGNSSTPSRRR